MATEMSLAPTVLVDQMRVKNMKKIWDRICLNYVNKLEVDGYVFNLLNLCCCVVPFEGRGGPRSLHFNIIF